MMYRQVADFHRVFGQLVAEEPSLPSPEIRALRSSLIEEEYKEYLKGEENNDIVNVANELADLCYVIAGTAVAYGIIPELNSVIFLDTPLYHVPSFAGDDYRAKRIAVLTGDWQYYLGAERENNLTLIGVALRAMMDTIAITCYIYGIPLKAVFDEIHRANISKASPDGVVLRRQDGKVLKPATFKAADVKAVMFS